MSISKKWLSSFLIMLGLGAMLFAPISQAGWWYRHHWHRSGRIVRIRGCRRIVIQRYCRVTHWGNRICRRVRRVQNRCW